MMAICDAQGAPLEMTKAPAGGGVSDNQLAQFSKAMSRASHTPAAYRGKLVINGGGGLEPSVGFHLAAVWSSSLIRAVDS